MMEQRQWLLTECEGGSREAAKVSDVSWTRNQTISGQHNNFCEVFSRNRINFILLVLYQSICAFQDCVCCPPKLLCNQCNGN